MQIGTNLRAARERAALSQAEASRRAGLGESSLSEFENDRRAPSLAQLEALARSYSCSVASLLADEPRVATAVLWRHRPSSGAEDLEVRFLRLAEQYSNLERWCGDLSRAPLPLEAVTASMDASAAEELARGVRQRLGLGDRPALALLRVLEEDHGVKVFHLAFEPTGTAACARSDVFGDAILLNTNNVRWRRNYDLAHELFHLLTWSVFRTGTSATSSANEEKLADRFASALLLPEEALRSAVTRRLTDSNKLTTAAVFELARDFDVSIDALLWRLHDVYGGTDREYTRTRLHALRGAAKLYEERSKDVPPTRPERFRALAITALRSADISIGRFAEYLGITRGEAMKYADEEAIADEALELPSR